MDNDNSAVDNFLQDLSNKDGDSVLDSDKSQNLFNDQEEREEKQVEEVVEEKPLPFHKDPKVQKFIEKELEKRLEEFKQIPQQITREDKQEVDKLTQAWTELVGNDDPAKLRVLEAIKETFKEAEERGARKALEELDNRQNAKIQAEQQAERELQEGFEAIEDTFNVDLSNQKLRNSFIEFVERVAPKKNGEIVAYPDFVETFKTFQELHKPQPNLRAREIASRSVSHSGDAPENQQNRDYSWKGVDEAFSKLFGK